MKRYTLLFALMIVLTSVQAVTNTNPNNQDSCDYEVSSHTYMSMVQPFQSNSPELIAGFRSDRTHAARQDEEESEKRWFRGGFQAVIFGGRTTGSDHTARYYFPFGKTSLLVDEDLKQVSEINKLDPIDLYSGMFGVETKLETFRSRISIAPRQTIVGGGLHWRQSIWRCKERERGIWASISFPIVHVKNQVNLTETIENDGGGIFTNDVFTAPAANMKDALNQTAYKFGKISDCADDMKRTGVADLEIKLGCEWLEDPCHLESYIGVHVPTGNRPKGEYLMEAIVGAGKHVGIMFGNSLGYQIYADEAMDRSIRMEVAIGSKYLFKKSQIRSFDLKYKPWSRYIQMYANIADATAAATNTSATLQQKGFTTPGINILTQEVDVTPGFMHSLNAAWVVKAKWFAGELGYNLLSRQSECIKMNCFKQDAAIKHILGTGQTNPVRDMTGNFLLESTEGIITGNMPVPLALYEQSVLLVSDIDLASAATPAHLAHTVYGSLGGNFDECRWPMLAHFGASYTFSRATNAVMDRWTIWAKFGVSI